MKNVYYLVFAVLLIGCATVSHEKDSRCFDSSSCLISMRDKIESNWSKPPCMDEGDQVLMNVLFERNGNVENVKILKGSGNYQFDESAIKAVNKSSPFEQIEKISESEKAKKHIEITIQFSPKVSGGEINACPKLNKKPSFEIKANSSDKEMYNTALENIKIRQFSVALEQLERLVTSYPKSSYVPGAHYWAGEVSLAIDPPDHEKAQINFNTLIETYPNDPKVPDAIYKLGKMKFITGERVKAKAYFNEVVSKYPDSQVSNLAREFLKRFD